MSPALASKNMPLGLLPKDEPALCHYMCRVESSAKGYVPYTGYSLGGMTDVT